MILDIERVLSSNTPNANLPEVKSLKKFKKQYANPSLTKEITVESSFRRYLQKLGVISILTS